jgi:cytochrome c oxidase cbb3-type subunit III
MSDHSRPGSSPEDENLRPHVYDGIQEYDNRLPNWWLYTLYGAIVFTIGYWFYYAHSDLAADDGARVVAEMARIDAAKLANQVDLNDETLWQMSRNSVFTNAGRESYLSLCAACHLPSLRGQAESPAAIGPSLVDGVWIHGGDPMAIYRVIDAGILDKGMPAWGPVLGSRKTAEVTAYVLSRQPAGGD